MQQRELRPNPFLPPMAQAGFAADVQSGPTIGLLGCDGIPADMQRACTALGLRCFSISPSHLHQGLPITAAIIWARIAEAKAPWVETLHDRAKAEALPLIVQTRIEALDTVEALFGALPDTSLLVEVDEIEIATTLARRLSAVAPVLHASAAGEHLREQQIVNLQEEVQRIGRMLARLAAEPAPRSDPPSPFIEDHVRAPNRDFRAGDVENGPTLSARDVRTIIRQRRLRDELFDADLFADPAWDMLLDLYAAQLDRTRVSVSSLCIAAAVPATTALRWIKTLTDSGLFIRNADVHDARRIFITLSDAASQAMHRYCARLTDPRLAV